MVQDLEISQDAMSVNFSLHWSGNATYHENSSIIYTDAVEEEFGPEVDSCGWVVQRRAPRAAIDYLDKASYPFLLVLSTIGNVLNLLVLRRESPRTSKNVYLMSMACTDFCYMYVGC